MLSAPTKHVTNPAPSLRVPSRVTALASSPVADVSANTIGVDSNALYANSSAEPTPRSAPVISTTMRYVACRRHYATPLRYPARSNARSPAPATMHPRTTSDIEPTTPREGSGF